MRLPWPATKLSSIRDPENKPGEITPDSLAAAFKLHNSVYAEWAQKTKRKDGFHSGTKAGMAADKAVLSKYSERHLHHVNEVLDAHYILNWFTRYTGVPAAAMDGSNILRLPGSGGYC